MGKPIKTNVQSKNKKNKTNVFSVLVKGLKKMHPTAIDIELRWQLGLPVGFNFRIKKDGEIMQTKFVKQ